MSFEYQTPAPRALCAIALLALVLSARGAIAPNSPTTEWKPVLYPAGSLVTPDPFSDQQTGSKEGDIVGSSTVASFFTQFYNAGTPSLTDGQIAFRLRIAEEQNPPGFSGAAFIGIDGNSDGKLDVFVGVNNSGSTAQIGLWRAGTGLNTMTTCQPGQPDGGTSEKPHEHQQYIQLQGHCLE